MSSIITADWFPLGKDAYFRKFDLYQISYWAGDIDVDNMLICPAPYGGPIAVVRDRKKLIKVQVATKPVINIYSSAGEKIGSILWNSGQLLNMGWSSEEHLLCVKNDGQVLVYNIFGSFVNMFSMGDEASATKIIEAKFFPSPAGTGLAVLTSKLRIFIVNSVGDPKVRQFPPIPTNLSRENPTGWEIISERHTSIIISTAKELTLLRQGEPPSSLHPDLRQDCSGFIDMCVSLDNRHIAVLTDTGILWLGSSDMKRKYCEIDTKCTSRPKQIVWCGADAVVGNWTQELQIVSIHGGYASLPCPTPVWLIPEIDCVRVLGAFNHEIIQRVPLVTQKLFNLNSTEPGSYLLEASKQFERKSHTCYDYIHLVRGNMETAVSQCIDGAGKEFNTEVQKSLLRGARLGRTFAPDASSSEFVNMCRILRVLNAVRNPRIGIPLTYAQLHHIKFRTLLDRLVYRRQYKAAIEMAEYLKVPEADGASRILNHWACHKVKQAQVDQPELAIEIGRKLQSASGVSFSAIANEAVDAGRTQLAIKLIDFESQASLQVPLLLRLNQRKTALERAVACGNTDLVLCVMMSLRETMPLGDFQLLIRAYPLAQNLYKKHCKLNAPETLRDLYGQGDNWNAQAECFLEEYFDTKNASKEVSLNSAAECYTKGKNDFLAGICKDELKLLNYQKSLTEKFGQEFVGLSIHDTVHDLLVNDELKLAEKLRLEFKVPDKRFWWLRLETMAEKNDWKGIENFAKSKKSPVGYEPFVEVCLSRKNISEAIKYLPRVQEDLKVKYYVKVGQFQEAASIAYQQRNADALRYILSRAGSSAESLTPIVNQYLSQLNAKK